MPNLTPEQHAQFGCGYLDELVQVLQSSRWCFHDTFAIENKISQHAKALGVPAPFDRPFKPEHETAEELQIWLKTHDPVTDSRQERLICRMIFAPPPAAKGTVLKTVYRPLDEREQAEFRQLVERLKREFQRHGQFSGNAQKAAVVAPNVTTWQQAMKAAEDHCARNPFPGVNALAKIVGCSPSTMSKACNRSAKLRAKLVDHENQRKSVSAVAMTDGAAQSMKQEREPDPIDAASASTDDLFRRLLDQCETTDERIRLQQLTPQQRRELVATIEHDPL